MSKERQDIELILLEALERQAPGERATFLDQVCGDDARMRAELESLLGFHARAGDFLQTPPLAQDVGVEESVVTDGPGSVIGRYKLLERIGEGGMAVVYMAEQERPIRRKVALKVIKLGMDTRQVIARFEAERQALALMDHPSIAKVLDAGATETGRPYFVMELVTGVSITEYCDANHLSTKDRLDLFAQVCQAVQHAHQKGIIHRDIKPSNVLVTMHDGAPVPKVIDFGIAKATNQRLTEKTLFTRYAHIIGTPAYMSPEQAELSDADVDTRSDIYSLGVLLYELLTGTPPFTDEELRKVGYVEMQRVICQREPAKPSTRLTTLGDTMTDVAKRRSTSPDLLRRTVRGELDWIVMKALEKDRTRRYDSTVQLLGDIQRYRKNEPVFAGPPSAWYQTKKFLQRHGKLVALLLFAATALLVGTAVVTFLYARMQNALHTVSRLETRAEMDRTLSSVRRLHSQGRHQTALNELEPAIAAGDLGPEALLLRAQLLIELKRGSEAETQLLRLTQSEPQIAATAHGLLARLYINADAAKAAEHETLAKSMLPETAEAYVLRAMTASDGDEALEWLNQAVALDPSYYPARRARALIYYCREEDERMVEDVAVLIALRPHDHLGYAMRAVLRRESGQLDGALLDHKRAIDLCENPGELAEVHAERYVTFLRLGDCESALAEARRLHALQPRDIGRRLDLITCLLVLERYDEAQREYRSIVQTDHLWHRCGRTWLTYYVFGMLEAGQRPAIPADRMHEAPFARVQRAIQCYDLLARHAKRIPAQRQGYILCGWSPDSTKVLCWALGAHGAMRQTLLETVPSVSYGYGLKIIDVDSGEEQSLIPGFSGFAAWSPNGRYIAYRDGDRNLCLISPEGRRLRTLVPGELGPWCPQWSADSQRVYFKQRSNGNELYSIDIDEPGRIRTEPPVFPGPYVVCEKGNWLAYSEPKGIGVLDLSSGSRLYHCRPPWPLKMWGMRPSASGRELFFASWWSGIDVGPLVLDIEQSRLYQVFNPPVDQLLWSPDGTKLAIGAARGIWVMEIDPNLPVSQRFGREIPDGDLRQWELDKLTDVIEAGSACPEDYLERAVAYLSLDRYEEAHSDLTRFCDLVTSDDHHVGYELFWWLRQCTAHGLHRQAATLTPYAAELMNQFPTEVPSYANLIEEIISLNERDGKTDLADRWQARLRAARLDAPESPEEKRP